MEPAADMTVLEKQRARLNWQQQQQQHQRHNGDFSGVIPWSLQDTFLDPFSLLNPGIIEAFHSPGGIFGDGGTSFTHDFPSSVPSDYTPFSALDIPFSAGGGEDRVVGAAPAGAALRKLSCQPAVAEREKKFTSPSGRIDSAVEGAEHHATNVRGESSGKRKAVHQDGCKQEGEGDNMDMDTMIKGSGPYTDTLIEPKLEYPDLAISYGIARVGKDRPTSSNEPSSETSKEKRTKVSQPPAKTDYIHVRARRGQATDSHSLAERVRREKISRRMKLLQDLVPGCSKVTGKAGVLEEIINYVQSLQRQVEFLSMKLATTVNSIMDDNINMAAVFNEEMIPWCGSVVPPLTGMVPTPETLDAPFLVHANGTVRTHQALVAMQTAVESSSLEMAFCCGCADERALAAVLQVATAATPSSAPAAAACCSALEPTFEVQAVSPTSPWEVDLDGFYDANELRRRGAATGVPPPSAAACSGSDFRSIPDAPCPAPL